MNRENIAAMAAQVAEKIAGEFPEHRLEVTNVTKNNGLELTGIMLKGDSSIAPTVYLDPERTVEENADRIRDTFNRYLAGEGQLDFDIDSFLDWDTVKGKIYPMLINAGQNSGMLSDTPHLNIGEEIACVFRYLVTGVSEGQATILVKNDHVRKWGVTEADLLSVASENLASEVTVQTMAEVMAEVMRSQGMPEEIIDQITCNPFGPQMYVVSNERKINGAAAIALPSTYAKLREKTGAESFYVIPSSIHEVICIPANETAGNDIEPMIGEVNATQLSPEEVLSDRLFYLDENGFRLAEEREAVEEAV